MAYRKETSSGSDILLYVLAVFVPPLALALRMSSPEITGCDIIINVSATGVAETEARCPSLLDIDKLAQTVSPVLSSLRTDDVPPTGPLVDPRMDSGCVRVESEGGHDSPLQKLTKTNSRAGSTPGGNSERRSALATARSFIPQRPDPLDTKATYPAQRARRNALL